MFGPASPTKFQHWEPALRTVHGLTRPKTFAREIRKTSRIQSTHSLPSSQLSLGTYNRACSAIAGCRKRRVQIALDPLRRSSSAVATSRHVVFQAFEMVQLMARFSKNCDSYGGFMPRKCVCALVIVLALAASSSGAGAARGHRTSRRGFCFTARAKGDV
jgi:hypothetical protein